MSRFYIGAGASYTFSCNETGGAVAILEDYGKLEQILSCSEELRRYLEENYSSWHSYAQSRRYRIQPDALLFVSGYIKTSAWTISVFSTDEKAREGSLDASAGSGIAIQINVSNQQSDMQMHAFSHSGPQASHQKNVRKISVCSSNM